ncbi:hypothetical protein CVO74_18770 [Xanthomonas prunicola]|uniref:Uncharacterized protein n=1 Tax=Xanthomonas prunicola TaxID=2053930 RepID=A0A2N3RFY6_9XANT|nr:hypothetical protein XpruCFBP8353_17635 [Xanthomonas prunicola]PKV15725.1 hypothetical protein XpruCFBP8354_16935 [Xanthomonas prunicola]PKV20121.1 hypothetical protein CVO74_18770 [Xanthomonas prunicola]
MRRAADRAACGVGVLMPLMRLRCAARQMRLAVVAAHAVLRIKATARHASSFTAGRAVLRWRAWPCVRR